MFQLLQSLWRGGCIVFIVYHKGPTWRGCSLVTNLAILQNFRTPTALSWPKGCSSARFSLWLQHHPFFEGGLSPLGLASPSQQPSWDWEAASSGVWSLARLSLFSLYTKRCWWRMSPVTLRLWSRAVTCASVWKSGWRAERWGARTACAV